MSEPELTGSYRLDELGWAQFERVCEELLAAEGLAGLAWSGRADRLRTAVVEHPPASAGLPGPMLVAVAWLRPRPRPGPDRRIGYLLSRSQAAEGCASVLAMTNDLHVSAGGIRDAVSYYADFEPMATHVIGAFELQALLRRHAVVSRLVPSLLGVCDLPAQHDGEPTWDLAAARELARVFVPTRAYRNTLSILEWHNFAVLSGPPEMGKTAIARVLGLALQLEGWEVHECIRPEQIWQAFAPGRRQLFVADDAFGSTEYRPDAAEHWALELPRILQSLSATHKLLWTSRPAPLRAGLGLIHREHGVERFPEPAEVSVDPAALDVEEKATILLRHAKAAGLTSAAVGLVRVHGQAIVGHPHFTPERIRRFVRVRLPPLAASTDSPSEVKRAIAREIAEPTQAMAASFEALPAEHRALLVALVDAPPGPVSHHDLARSARRHAPEGLPRPPAELIDRLGEHFLREVPPDAVTWIHPSWRDLVIDHVAADPEVRRRFARCCSIEGILLALSHEGGSAGARSRPFLVADADWDSLTDRVSELVPQLADPDLIRLLEALAYGLRRSQDTELEALADAALRAIAKGWARGQYASAVVLDRWADVSELVPEAASRRVSAVVWNPPAAQQFMPPPRIHSAMPASVEWADLTPDDGIVSRILADLDAA